MEKPIRIVVFEEFEDKLEMNGVVWVKEHIEHTFSGHLYRNSGFETSSDCGNCDGANCDWCREEWVVVQADIPTRPWFNHRRFDSREEAEKFLK